MGFKAGGATVQNAEHSKSRRGSALVADTNSITCEEKGVQNHQLSPEKSSSPPARPSQPTTMEHAQNVSARLLSERCPWKTPNPVPEERLIVQVTGCSPSGVTNLSPSFHLLLVLISFTLTGRENAP
ncbi:hypothetical protein H920_19854 [Fukomys damarensis]|uniref:Uncharacterized protein n=1 Tax=Fukomys damarensis TaxID=885580 RepID=A0A091CJQ8_FUKDA|nr:hypothetical protein H920_19854 [Fukomys damarensis]